MNWQEIKDNVYVNYVLYFTFVIFFAYMLFYNFTIKNWFWFAFAVFIELFLIAIALYGQEISHFVSEKV